MTRKKLKKIKREIAAARKRTNTYRDLARIASSLERRQAKGSEVRGKEPAFISMAFPDASPITIPNHAGKDIKRGTQHNILNQFEGDVFRFEETLDEDSDNSDKERDNGNDEEEGYIN